MKISPFKLLCGAGLFAIFSSTISKNPVLPLFASYLGAGPSGVGAVAAVSSFTGILASIPAGILSDRFGRKKMLMAAAVVFATAPFLYLAVTEIWQLAIVRFYHGLATAIFVPVAMAAVADLFHAERGEKLGWFSTSTLAGRFVAPLAGGAIIGAAVLSPVFGYRAVFLVCGASGIIALALTALLFRLRIPYTGAGREGKTNLGQDLQAFKALLSVDSVGGSFLLFANPVGRQEYDNINFLERHGFLSDDFNCRRGYTLPFGSEASANLIWDLFSSGKMFKAFTGFSAPTQTSELGDNGVPKFWELITDYV